MGDAWHVEPGGDWVDHEDGPVRLRKVSVGSMDNNVYVVTCTATGASLVVDAAAEAGRIVEAIGDTEPVAVVQTHGHWDHVRAWDDLHDRHDLPVWGHPGDAELFPRSVDRGLSDGDVLDVGELSVEVMHVPGHTPGSCTYVVAGAQRTHLLTGDTLFPGGPGRTTSPEEFATIMDGLEARVFDRFDDETRVHPGHGDSTTLGAERPQLHAWRERGW
ncbi:MBL fold metallo-hydrolase [Salsipaludibacter albus]|uniref:MBL fold metallo-hydrolase n=1 Tax=Salsipaludibacter albus TaxID=2849650 RepID=UPI001EE4BCEE|nr:MBL fold metallo-hydrolase [Salsipaludibacter albus]